MACNAYAQAVQDARTAPVNDWGTLTRLLAPPMHWAAVAMKTGAVPACLSNPLSLEQIHDLKIVEFVSFYVSRLDPAVFGQNFDRLMQEVDFVIELRRTAQLLDLTAAEQKLIDRAQHPLLDALRPSAYNECRNSGRHEFLGRLRTIVVAADYDDDDLLDDLQYCATRVTWRVDDTDQVGGNATGTFGGVAAGSRVDRGAAGGVAKGRIILSGDLRAFRCPDGTFDNDQLTVTLNGVQVHTRNATGGAFLGTPIQLDAEPMLQAAGISPSSSTTARLVVSRRSSGCGRYVQFLGDMPLLTLELGYPAARLVYSNDFTSGADAAWSVQQMGTTPSGQRYLGPFDNASVQLTLDELQPHQSVRVEFDLYIMRTWDGNNDTKPGNGPDIVTVSIDGIIQIRTTFSNVNGLADHMQAYPDSYPGGSHPAGTGASGINTLGYVPGSSHHNGDSTYRLVFDIPHTAGSVRFEVRAQGLSPIPDEFWGVDNVRVSVR